MAYRQRLLEHLVSYKQQELNVSERGLWHGREYDHILPRESVALNLLPEIRLECWEHIKRHRISLHHGFGNLNSSQALCFNLFFPLIASNAFANAFARSVLGIDNPVRSLHFEREYEDRSSIDFVIVLSSGSTLLFECKLTEREFGVADEDEEHLLKLKNVYRPKLEGSVSDEALQPSPFFKNYQLLRNVFCLDVAAGDRLYLLYPEDNEHLRQANPSAFLGSCLIPSLAERVKVLGLRDVVGKCEAIGRRLGHYEKHFTALRLKYLC